MRKRNKKKKKRRRRKEEKEMRLSQKGKGFWFDYCKIVFFFSRVWFEELLLTLDLKDMGW